MVGTLQESRFGVVNGKAPDFLPRSIRAEDGFPGLGVHQSRQAFLKVGIRVHLCCRYPRSPITHIVGSWVSIYIGSIRGSSNAGLLGLGQTSG